MSQKRPYQHPSTPNKEVKNRLSTLLMELASSISLAPQTKYLQIQSSPADTPYIPLVLNNTKEIPASSSSSSHR